MKTFKIKVTQADIDEGVVGNCDACPIAIAAERAGVRHPQVYSRKLYCRGEETTHTALPERAQEFIRAFDSYLDVKPFSFEVTL